MFEKWKARRYDDKLKAISKEQEIAEQKHALTQDFEQKFDAACAIKDAGERYLQYKDLLKEVRKAHKKHSRFPFEKIPFLPILAIADFIYYRSTETNYEYGTDPKFRSLRRRYLQENAELGPALLDLKDQLVSRIEIFQKSEKAMGDAANSPHYATIVMKYPEMRKAFLKYADSTGVKLKPVGDQPVQAPVVPPEKNLEL